MASKGWTLEAIARAYKLSRADIRAMISPPVGKPPRRPRPRPAPRVVDRRWDVGRGPEYRDIAGDVMPAIDAAEPVELPRAQDLGDDQADEITPGTSAEEWGSFHATAGRDAQWLDD